jgi:leader peptidase (prepilin peptidase)/N-methyltransferase
VTVDQAVIVAAGVIGVMLGSFLNVCIHRWPREESVIRPRSRCPGCGQMIAWYDNIPAVSWLLLSGRCRHCRAPISVQYPLVELAMAGLWAFMAGRYGLTWQAASGAIFFSILLGIAMTDAREYIIPDEFSLGGLVFALLLSLARGSSGLIEAVIGAIAGFLLLWTVGAVGRRLFKEEAMGGGDIKMMAMVGAFVGWQGVLLTVFLGALLGTIIFVPLSLIGQKKLVPFGVFLSLGSAATWLAGPAIIAWYRMAVLEP